MSTHFQKHNLISHFLNGTMIRDNNMLTTVTCQWLLLNVSVTNAVPLGYLPNFGQVKGTNE
jgi:hypothetical protein